MAYYLYRFGDDVIFPLTMPITEMPTAPAQAGRVATVAGGFDAWGSDTAPAEFPYQVQYRVMVAEDTAADYIAVVNALRAMARTRDYVYRIGQDHSVQRALARVASLTATDTVNTFASVELSFTFEIWSHWEARWDRSWTLDDGHYLDTGLYLDDAPLTTTLTTSPQTVTVPNNGNLPVDDAVLTVTAGDAAITALTIACGAAKWAYAGTIAAGDSLVVDAGAWSVKNDGTDAFDDFSFDAAHALDGLFRLAVGNNSVVVTRTGGGTGSTINFEFAELYA